MSYFSSALLRYFFLFLIILSALMALSYLKNEWDRMLERQKSSELLWGELIDSTQDTEVQAILRLRPPERILWELDRNIATQQQEVDELRAAIRLWHPPWAESRLNHRIADEKLKAVQAARDQVPIIIAGIPPPEFIDVAWSLIKKHSPVAAILLLFVIFTPIALKIVFYYVLSPICEGRPAFNIATNGRREGEYEFIPSAVSQSLLVAPTEEILLKKEFLQTSAQQAEARTVLFLNKSIPFSSFLSGMFLLTRIRSSDKEPTRVTVSSQLDGFLEVGLLEVPLGASIVIKPRFLAGVIKSRNEEIAISRHWRLNYLHAWLTLQLRFLVFHGPCKLLVKGQRGIRVEEPPPPDSRRVNQSSTLGFCTPLQYSCTRCETFWSYLLGKDTLFNDHFSGSDGFFVYEEMPYRGRRGPGKGGIEGIFEGFLKVLGL